MNSIKPASQTGNFLVSSRNTWAVYQLGHSYGEILWILGGRHSSFKLGPGVPFAWQHDATRMSDGIDRDLRQQEERRRSRKGARARIDVHDQPEDAHREAGPPVGQSRRDRALPEPGRRAGLANTDQLARFGQIGVVSEFWAGALTFQLSCRRGRSPTGPTASLDAKPEAPPVAYATRAAGGADDDGGRKLERRHGPRRVGGPRRPAAARSRALGSPAAQRRSRDASQRRDDGPPYVRSEAIGSERERCSDGAPCSAHA